VPAIVSTILMVGLLITDHFAHPHSLAAKIAFYSTMGIVGIVYALSYLVASAGISGVTAVIITQVMAAPLRPVELRVAFGVLKKRWRPFLKTMFRVTVRMLIGYCLLFIPGIVVWIRYSLYGPVVLIEGLEKKEALKRARALASRSWRTMIIVSLLQILIPMVVSFFVGRIRLGTNLHPPSWSEQIYQQFAGLVNIFIVPLISIVPALLYVKMRQLGGEPLSSALTQIEGAQEGERREWQQRMRTRVSLHTPTSHKTASSANR
jgi:hypothetical protein